MADESIKNIVKALKANKVKEWEIYVQSALSNQTFLRRNEIELTHGTDTKGFGIRIHDKGIGFISSDNFSNDVLDSLVKSAVSMARTAKEVKFEFPAGGKVKKVDIVDKKIVYRNSEDSLKNYADQFVSLVKERKIEISFAKLKAFDVKTELLNSEGLSRKRSETYFFLETSLKAEREFWATRYARRLDDFPMQKIDQWISLAKKISDSVEPVTEKTTVILSPDAMIDTLVPVINFHSIASSLKKKTTAFLPNKKVASNILTVVDDGTYPFGLMSSPFDDEGIPQKPKTLIDKGTFKSHLYNQFYASNMGKKSTGCGWRQRQLYPMIDDRYSIQPVDQTSNLVVMPGKKNIEKIISEIRHGLIVYKFSWMAPHEESGSFSSEIRNAAYIENGEITRPVKGGIISGNVFDLINNVSAISKESEVLSGATAFSGVMPYARFENVQVAGK